MESPLPRVSRTAIVMSRLPRLIDPGATWLNGLRASLRRVHAHQQTLLLSSGTAGADFIRRGAQQLEIHTQDAGPAAAVRESEWPSDSVALDRQIAFAADELLVLGIRPSGNWHQLLIERLKQGRLGVILVNLESLQPQVVRQELLDCGAESWTPAPSATTPFRTSPSDVREAVVNGLAARQPPASICTLHPISPASESAWLTHTTRECPGPWPKQAVDDYLDSVLACRNDGLHSALATLIRIVQQQRLIASGRTIRGGHSVVSFTAVPLQELPRLRCFRTHRFRWDFEPYGVCIRRSALIERGARPVIYGPKPVWNELSLQDQPYFQLCNRTAEMPISDDSGSSSIDWSREQEWRYAGTLDLSQFDRKDVTIFVPTYEAARQVAPYSPWPVTLWPADVLEKNLRRDISP